LSFILKIFPDAGFPIPEKLYILPRINRVRFHSLLVIEQMIREKMERKEAGRKTPCCLRSIKIGTHTIFLDTNQKRVLNTTYAANCKNSGNRVPSPHHPKR